MAEMTKEEKYRRQKKCKSLRTLSENIQSLRNNVTRDLKSDDEKKKLTALAIALIDKTAERVGNSSSADNGHFGVTGWQNKHISVNGGKVELKYVGKSGVSHEKQFTDKKIADLLKKLKQKNTGNTPLLTTSDGFSIKSAQVNRYLKDFGITAKDIRGYAANTMIIQMLNNSNKSTDEDERKKKFREVIKSVAEKVGHQQATLKQHYLLPDIEESYVKRSKVKEIKKASINNISKRVASDFYSLIYNAINDRENKKTFRVEKMWDEIESLSFSLAKICSKAKMILKKYNDSEIIWSYVLPSNFDPQNVAIVNCIIYFNTDGECNLKTIIDTAERNDIDDYIGSNNDVWLCSVIWTLNLAMKLNDVAHMSDIIKRIKMSVLANNIVNKMKEQIYLIGKDLPATIVLSINDWDLPDGKIGSFKFDDENLGLMVISPNAFNKEGFFKYVIVHEMIHGFLGISSYDHGDEFKYWADFFGLPPKYQD